MHAHLDSLKNHFNVFVCVRNLLFTHFKAATSFNSYITNLNFKIQTHESMGMLKNQRCMRGSQGFSDIW